MLLDTTPGEDAKALLETLLGPLGTRKIQTSGRVVWDGQEISVFQDSVVAITDPVCEATRTLKHAEAKPVPDDLERYRATDVDPEDGTLELTYLLLHFSHNELVAIRAQVPS